jgi:hypothetical protein
LLFSRYGPIGDQEVMNGVNHLKEDFIYASNSMFKRLESLKMEVNDRRSNEVIMMEIQLVGLAFKARMN